MTFASSLDHFFILSSERYHRAQPAPNSNQIALRQVLCSVEISYLGVSVGSAAMAAQKSLTKTVPGRDGKTG
jgi:hypothetical protein